MRLYAMLLIVIAIVASVASGLAKGVEDEKLLKASVLLLSQNAVAEESIRDAAFIVASKPPNEESSSELAARCRALRQASSVLEIASLVKERIAKANIIGQVEYLSISLCMPGSITLRPDEKARTFTYLAIADRHDVSKADSIDMLRSAFDRKTPERKMLDGDVMVISSRIEISAVTVSGDDLHTLRAEELILRARAKSSHKATISLVFRELDGTMKSVSVPFVNTDGVWKAK